MRKVKFYVNGKQKEGYFVGFNGTYATPQTNEHKSILVVEDLEGKIYSVFDYDITFTNKPSHSAPPKYIDLKLMRKALENLQGFGKPYTIQDLIDLAINENIIVQDTEE